MIGILKMIASRGYWRNMFQRDTWRVGWVSLRRCHKDRRARQYLRRLLLMLLAPLLAPLCVVLIFTPGGALGTLIAFARMRQAKKKKAAEDAAKPAVRPPPPPPSPEFRREIADLALLHAVFADRAGSEDFLRTKILPEGIEVITRRIQLDLLRDRGLYERLNPTVRDLLLRADGHWTPTDCRNGTLALEPLRVLRWGLRADHYLPSVGETLRLNFQLASTTVKDPAALDSGTDFIPYDTLNAAFRDAANFMHRCYAEAIHRKLMEPTDDEDQAEAQRIVSTFGDDEHKDLVLDGVIVSKASDFDVLHARLLAARRYHLLSWIAHRLYGDIPAPETLPIFFLDPAPSEAVEQN